MTSPRLGLTTAPRWLAPLLTYGAALPAIGIVAMVVADVFFGASFMGADPIKQAEHELGEWTIRFLLASLAVTPLRQITGWNWLARHRRTLGLYGFAYGCVHFLTWALLDVQIGISEYVGWADIRKDLTKRPFIVVGMSALLLMLPLAVTSTASMIARLGRRWRVLHRLAYLIPALGVIHWWMSVKKDVAEPAMGAAVLALLLGWRVMHARRATSST